MGNLQDAFKKKRKVKWAEKQTAKRGSYNHVKHIKEMKQEPQFLRRARRDVRAMGVVTLGVSLSAMTASGGKKKSNKTIQKKLGVAI